MEAPEPSQPNSEPIWDVAEALAYLIRAAVPNLSTDQMDALAVLTGRLRVRAAAEHQGAEAALEAACQRLTDREEVLSG